MTDYMQDRQLLKDGMTPMPGMLPGGCCRCGGPCHIYEHDLQDTPEGLVCGNCTRIENKRKGRDPRAIDPHFKWRHGHAPSDDEATPESGFEYHTLQVEDTPAPPSQKEGLNGPESGVPCFNCLSRGRNTMTRLVATVDAYEMLKDTGYTLEPGTLKTEEKDVMVICPECTSVTHWREEEYVRARNKNG